MDLTKKNTDRNIRRKPALDLGTLVYGKVPPQDVQIEKVVLGACMLERDAFPIVSDILKAQTFYSDAHQRIFTAMVALSMDSKPIDSMTVCEQLIKDSSLEIVGGPYYISKLTESVVSSAHIEAHARILVEKFVKRELIRASGEIMGDAYEDSTDFKDLLNSADQSITEITTGNFQKAYIPLTNSLVKSLQRIDELRAIGKDLTGIPSGFYDLDKITHGWQDGKLIVLAARPAVGKTAFALNLARAAAGNPHKTVPVGFFSLEMEHADLVSRLLSAESEIDIERLETGNITDDIRAKLYKDGADKLEGLPIFIDDTHSLTLGELRAKARSMKRKENIGMIIIDYLQLMSGDESKGGNREQVISSISRGLKGLAKELKIPIIALAQLSREVEKRKGKDRMPMLADLRESGAIEQDADMVMFLYRAEYYDNTTNEWGESTKGETDVKIAKHRGGKLGMVHLRANLSIQKFYSTTGMEAITEKLGAGTWKSASFSEPRSNQIDDLPF